MATKLPRQLYRRGEQGTLVYSPDIAVFVKLSNDEILDLSPYIVDFNIGRVVNDMSNFSCSIDNRFGQFDRVIKRMDRITVFLKRISWLQVFSGYVTTIPWQTVVPGNVTISAQCTIKRLVHNYVDVNSTEGMRLMPFFNEESWEEADGGAASTIVRLLTKVAKWPQENIAIQEISPAWANDAAVVLKGLLDENDVDMTGQEFQGELRTIKDSLLSLLDSLGWTGAVDGSLLDELKDNWSNFSAGTPEAYTNDAWRELVGSRPDNGFGYPAGSGGNVGNNYLFRFKSAGLEVRGNHQPGKGDYTKSFDIFLRLDAADSLADLVAAWIASGKREINKNQDYINIPVTAAYLDFETQRSFINAGNGGCIDKSTNKVNTTDSASSRFQDPTVVEALRVANQLGVIKPLDRTEKQEKEFNSAERKLINYEMARLGISITSSGPFKTGVPDMPYLEYQTTGGTAAPPSNPYSGTFGPVYMWKNEQVFWMSYPEFKFYKFDSGSRFDVSVPENQVDLTESAVRLDDAIPLKCPAGKSVFGWATAICIKPSTDFYQFVKNKLSDYGWKLTIGESRDPVWEFVGNDKYPIYWDSYSRLEIGSRKEIDGAYEKETYTGAYLNSDGVLPERMVNNGIKALFSVLWMGNQVPSPLSEFATGERSWLGDSSLLEIIKSICPASIRDFMSAPNGDFVAFVPDRLGKYSNFPVIQVRDIELIDFKAIASDGNLVTHYMSNADVEAAPLEGLDEVLQTYFTSAMMTVEQAPLMNFLLGRPIDQLDKEYGPAILQNFGLRPVIEDNKFIRNRAFNFMFALHRFQEMWSNQWQFVVNLTFMPELYPGMRIELVDRTLPDGTPAPVAVYVESVNHSGSRSTGFTTSAVVSTPMIKLNGKWTQYRPEFGPKEMPDSMEDVLESSKYSAKLKSLQDSGIIDRMY